MRHPAPFPFPTRVDLHVVSHTHWDREWYHQAARFRQRLVALVDELIASPPTAGTSFLLDGQAVVLHDYLAARPDRRDELAVLLQQGRLEAGPWYVLADELIPGGEALVRNLLAGRRALEEMGAEPTPVLYCPDSFGHPSALPAIAQGFGLGVVIAWRGYGGARWPSGDTVRWSGPDGSAVLLHHLPPDGYEFGSALPPDDASARARWSRIREVIEPRAVTSVALLLNGADHHARQARLGLALDALARAAMPVEVRPSSLRAFAAALSGACATRELHTVQGELRDSYGYAWTLGGTLASRAHQKRRARRLERMLVRDVEPLLALAGRSADRAVLDEAWRELLLCHPHDTLCGCSTDAVARAMDARMDSVAAQLLGLQHDALQALVLPQQDRSDSAPVSIVLVRNRSARARSGVAFVTLVSHLERERVGPGSGVLAPAELEHPAPPTLAGCPVQLLRQRFARDRIEDPRAYPRNYLASEQRVAVWVDEAPPSGLLPLEVGSFETLAAKPLAVSVSRRSLDNGLVRLDVDEQGAVTLRDSRTRTALHDLLRFESLRDEGDLYSPSLRGAAFRPRFAGARVVDRGPLRGTIELRYTLEGSATRVRVRLTIDAGLGALRIGVRGMNASRNHRLRIGIRSQLAAARCFADGSLGVVERVPLDVPRRDQREEHVVPTAPLQRYVSLASDAATVTLYSDGLAEYEATRDGTIWVTLLRAVGDLSRNDLPERRGHAGWPVDTPQAQCLGPFAAELAVALHSARTSAVIHEIEQLADDVLLPLAGATVHEVQGLPATIAGPELKGDGLAVSAIKPAAVGSGVVLRCINLLDIPVAGSWTTPHPTPDAWLARLDETALEPIEIQDHFIPFVAPPRGIVTIIVRS
ncbi:MAG: glycoside hydrolase family 38 [Gemmatimonadetes bacterium]|nr:glycoside hydrolase family 38 [Gemmatimonadota bacterium]